MERREHLRIASVLSILGLMLLAAAATLVFLSGGAASQERFEVFTGPAQYTAALSEAADYLRIVLAVDDVYILTYVGALCFAALGFRAGNPAAALAAGLGAIAVGGFDFWENMTMGTSLDMATAGQTVDQVRARWCAVSRVNAPGRCYLNRGRKRYRENGSFCGPCSAAAPGPYCQHCQRHFGLRPGGTLPPGEYVPPMRHACVAYSARILSAEDLPVRLSATMSKVTFCPSLRLYRPARSTALI